MKKSYFLFGGEACSTYLNAENGIPEFAETYEQKSFSATLFVWEDGVTTPTDLLGAFCGNDDYICLTEDEYDQLKEIL
jgi:hypothetical protein